MQLLATITHRIDAHEKEIQGQDSCQLSIACFANDALHNGDVCLAFGYRAGLVRVGLVHRLADVLHANAKSINSNARYKCDVKEGVCVCRNLRRKLIQGTDKTAIGLGRIETPEGHAKLQLWHRPEERIDGLNNLLCLNAALR